MIKSRVLGVDIYGLFGIDIEHFTTNYAALQPILRSFILVVALGSEHPRQAHRV